MPLTRFHALRVCPCPTAQVMCDSLGASMSDTCKSYVDTYAPALFTVLEQYLVQVQLCGMGLMCDMCDEAGYIRMSLLQSAVAGVSLACSLAVVWLRWL